MAYAYGNRSAVLNSLGCFDEALADLSLALAANIYPQDKREKLRHRQQNCLKQRLSKLSPSMSLQSPPKFGLRHLSNDCRGRDLYATADIESGELVLTDQPEAVASTTTSLPHTRCTYCAVPFSQKNGLLYRCISCLYCDGCSSATTYDNNDLFCSFVCMQRATRLIDHAHRSCAALWTESLVESQPRLAGLNSQFLCISTDWSVIHPLIRLALRIYSQIYPTNTIEQQVLHLQTQQSQLDAIDITFNSLHYAKMDACQPDHSDLMTQLTDKSIAVITEQHQQNAQGLFDNLWSTILPRLRCNTWVVRTYMDTNLLPTDTSERIMSSSRTEDVYEEPIAVALYPTVALINHSCNPNTIIMFEPNNNFTAAMVQTSRVIALRKIRAGESITLNYSDLVKESLIYNNSINAPQTTHRDMSNLGFVCQCGSCDMFRSAWRCLSLNKQCEAPLLKGMIKCDSCQTPFMSNENYEQIEDEIVKKMSKVSQSTDSARRPHLRRVVSLMLQYLHPLNTLLNRMLDKLAQIEADMGCFSQSYEWLESSFKAVKFYSGDVSAAAYYELLKLCQVGDQCLAVPPSLSSYANAALTLLEIFKHGEFLNTNATADFDMLLRLASPEINQTLLKA